MGLRWRYALRVSECFPSRQAGAVLTAHLRELTAALVPLEQDVAEVREVVEPLQGVSERVGRLTDRLPGGGSGS